MLPVGVISRNLKLSHGVSTLQIRGLPIGKLYFHAEKYRLYNVKKNLHTQVPNKNIINKDIMGDNKSATDNSKEVSYLKSLVNGFYSHSHSHQPIKAESHTHSTLEGFSHSHSHSHSQANPLLILDTEEMRKNAGVRITWIGLAVNVGIAVGKFIGGIVFHSQALFADSIHALSDMISDFLTLFSVRLASNKPTSDYPFGYGKIETVGSLAVSTILATAGISIGWSSLCVILGPIIPHTIMETLAALGGEAHSHIHTSSDTLSKEVANINAAWIAALSIAAKEWVFRATKKVAIETNSNVLMANAWHHRVDSLTSLVALVTISSGYLFNIQSLDMLGGLIVSGLIVSTGVQGMGKSIRELMDQSLEHDDDRHLEVEDVIKDVLNKVKLRKQTSNLELNELVVLLSGPNLMAHAKISVPSVEQEQFTIKELSTISHLLRTTLDKEVPIFKNLEIEYTEKNNLKDEQENDPDCNNGNSNAHEILYNHTHSHTHDHTHMN